MALKKKNHTPKQTSSSAQVQPADASHPKTPQTPAPSDSGASASRTAASGSLTAAGNAVELENITENMLRKIGCAVNAEYGYILCHAGTQEQPIPCLKGLHDFSPSSAFTIPETTIAFLSGISGGKSSLLNIGICKYPIIPAATTETSTCAVEIRRADSEHDERIEVCKLVKYGEKGAALEKKPLVIFKKQVFSEALFTEMYAYADYLMQERILTVGDSLGFFRDENGTIRLHRNNWRHCMVLLMIVLDGYIGQDKQNDPNQSAIFHAANQKRNALLKKLGIPLDKDYGVRLYWSSDMIPEHSVFVDLPGTGGITQSSQEHLGHSDLVSGYLSQVDSLICLFKDSAEIDIDSRDSISTFIEMNKIKGNSSTRITFVLNQADKTAEKHGNDKNATNNDLMTSINQFREKNPLCEEYPVYALSTYDGELLLLDSNILPENLHHASSIKSLMLNLGFELPEGKLLEIQKERYERAYPCQMRKNGAFGEQTFRQFIDTLITEYIGRIHFLQTLTLFREHINRLTSIAGVIHTQQELLKIAQGYSPELAQTLVNAISETMDKTIQDLQSMMLQLRNDILTQISQTSGRMTPIVKSFTDDYRVLSKAINAEIQNKVNSLETQKKNSIPISTNFVGGNSAGARNRDKLLSLGQDIAKIDFISHFKASFQKLENEFDSQRTAFNSWLIQLCSVIEAFPNMTVTAMKITFKTAQKPQGLDDEVYRKAMRAAEETTYKLLTVVCKQYIAQLQADTSILQTLNDTADRIQHDLIKILSVYTSRSFGADVINIIGCSHFFAADTIDKDKLTEFLSKVYITDFEFKMRQMLRRNFDEQVAPDNLSQGIGNLFKSAVSSTSPFLVLGGLLGSYLQSKNNNVPSFQSDNEPHLKRIDKAMLNLFNRFLSTEALEKLSSQVKNACMLVEDMFKNESNFEDWSYRLNFAANDLQNFFSEGRNKYFADDDGSAYAVILSVISGFSGEDWAKSPVSIAIGEANTAKAAAYEVKAAAVEIGKKSH